MKNNNGDEIPLTEEQAIQSMGQDFVELLRSKDELTFETIRREIELKMK